MHYALPIVAIFISIVVYSRLPPKWKAHYEDDEATDIVDERSIKSVTLAQDAIYRFYGTNVGVFLIRGGSSGTWYVDGAKVTIRDKHETKIFSAGGQTDRVSIEDDLENRTTTVTLLPGQGCTTGNGCTTDTSYSAVLDSNSNNIKFRPREPTIPVQATHPNVKITVRGSHNFVITGNGDTLSAFGSGDAVTFTVHGGLRSLFMLGAGKLAIRVNVNN